MQSGGSCSASPHKYLRGWPIPSQFLLSPATAVSVTTPQTSQCNAIWNKSMKCNTAAPSGVFLYSGPSLALSTTGLDPRSAHVRFMVDSVAVGKVLLPVLGFALSAPCHHLSYAFIHQHRHMTLHVRCPLNNTLEMSVGSRSCVSVCSVRSLICRC